MACVNQIYSASSKQRSNLRRAVSSDKAKLDIIVKQYNELSNEYDSTLFICTTTDTIIDGDFPWSRLTGICNKMFIWECKMTDLCVITTESKHCYVYAFTGLAMYICTCAFAIIGHVLHICRSASEC